MQLNNYYYWWNNVFTKEECEEIIKLGLSKLPQSATTAGGRDSASSTTQIPQNTKTTAELYREGAELDKVYIRDSKVSWLYDQWIYDKLWACLKTTNQAAGWNFEIDWAEDIQFTVYENSGFYGFHQDGGSDRKAAYKRHIKGVTPVPEDTTSYVSGKKQKNWIGKIRKLSMSVNLSDPNDYEGGNLIFDAGEHAENGVQEVVAEEIKPQGSIAVFPSFVPHCVSPVTKGTRYSLVMWALGRPFK